MYVFDYGWDWNYCMLIGSILAATDPVAVVGLLKEVGASKNLSTIIAGEAMLNDGTAVVFYLLFLDLATGATYSGGKIVAFFAQMALAGPLIGIAIAAACVWWGFYSRDATPRDPNNAACVAKESGFKVPEPREWKHKTKAAGFKTFPFKVRPTLAPLPRGG